MNRIDSSKIKHWLKYAIEELNAIIRRQGIKRIIIKFFAPWLVGIGALYAAHLTGVAYYIDLLKLTGAYMFNPLGAVIGVPAALKLNIDVYTAFSFMLLLDAVASAFIIWNLKYIRILPLIGRLVKWVEKSTETLLLRKPWIRNLAFLGVFLFVLIPFYATGSILGSFIGRIISMRPWRIWIAVMLGASIRLFLYFSISLGLVHIFA
jgi:uncharacterized membrane protein